MDPQSQRTSSSATAFQILHTGIHSSTEALADLQQYISHLEELLTTELGDKEFTRRLESLQHRDEETLFIPEDTPRPRKRSGSASTENGSSPKKSRSNSLASSLSLASNLGKSILDQPKAAQCNVSSPDVSPETSRKPSVSEIATTDDQKATAQKMALRSVRALPQPRRASQSALLPNVQPSSNFHSKSSLPLTKPSQDLTAAQSSQQRSLQNTSSQSQSPSNPFSKSIARKLPRKPAFTAAQFTFSANKSLSLTNKPSSSSTKPSPPASKPSLSSTKLSSSANKLSSPVSKSSLSSTKLSTSASNPLCAASKPSSSSNNPSSASRPSSGPDSSLGESTSVARKPWRAVKKG